MAVVLIPGMYFALALSIATTFWSARHVEIPCQPNVVVGTTADLILPRDEWGIPAAMGATESTCTIYISTFAAATRHNPLISAVYCGQVAHELGHLAGLGHSDDPLSIMYKGAMDDRNAPWDCEHWRSYAKRHSYRLKS